MPLLFGRSSRNTFEVFFGCVVQENIIPLLSLRSNSLNWSRLHNIYHPALPNLKNILMSKWHLIQNQPLLRETIERASTYLIQKKRKSFRDNYTRESKTITRGHFSHHHTTYHMLMSRVWPVFYLRSQLLLVTWWLLGITKMVDDLFPDSRSSKIAAMSKSLPRGKLSESISQG